MGYSEELRLLWFILLNTAALGACWCTARRFGSGSLSRAVLDTLLFNCVLQYTVVCGLGSIGLLSPVAISIATALIAGTIIPVTIRRLSPLRPLTHQTRAALAVLVFGGGYLLGYCIIHGDLPILETDALAYHLPTAVGWLQSGHLKLFESWYWNPANTYSPIAAEAFMVWLLAPMHSDIFVRHVQVPALIIVGLAMYRIGRGLGCGAVAAACMAVAAMLSRSIFAEATLVKDDLWMTAFFIAAVVSLAQTERDRLTPWRAGMALAMLVATKYPALLTLPLVALVLPRWRAKDRLIVTTVVVVIAGPWYLRNWVRYGNPLYPMILKVGGRMIFDGQFNVLRDASTRTPAAIWRMVSNPYFGMPAEIIIALGVLWAAGLAIWMKRRAPAGQPLNRFALWGPVVGPVAFTLLSPHPEIRYFFPFLLPLFAAACMSLAGMTPLLQIGIAAVLALWATATSFQWAYFESTLQFACGGAVLAVLAWVIAAYGRSYRRLMGAVGVAGMLCLSLYAYINWNSYVLRLLDAPAAVWPDRYGPVADVWLFARNDLPADATIAYANTYFVYPLMGPHFEHRVFYNPARKHEQRFDDLPRLGDRVPQDRIVETVTTAMNTDANESAWLKNLQSSGAGFVFIATRERDLHPPELEFISHHSDRFERVSPQNESAAVYRVLPDSHR